MKLARPLATLAVCLGAVVLSGWPSRGTVYYVHDPRMPLSEIGLDAAERFAKVSELGFRPISFDQLDELAAADPGLESLTQAASLHLPAVAVKAPAARVPDGVVLGFKTAEEYAKVFATASSELSGPAGESGLRRGRKVWTGPAERTAPGFFYRSVPTQAAFTLDAGGHTYVHDRSTGARWTGPGTLDLVPAPDGSFAVTPTSDGLAFHSWRSIKQAGPLGLGTTLAPAFVDPALADQYPSIGIVETADGDRFTRVMVSWFGGIKVRDYDLDPTGMIVRPRRGGVRRPCSDLALSTPIISPNGLYVSARDESKAATSVFFLGEDGRRCKRILDLGVATSKATFSPSSGSIGYSVLDPADESPSLRVRVTRLSDGFTEEVVGPTSGGLLIPDFVSEDTILVLRSTREVRFELWCIRDPCASG